MKKINDLISSLFSFKIVRKEATNKQRITYLVVAFVSVAIFLTLLLIGFGANPIKAFGEMLKGIIGSQNRIIDLIKTSTILILVSLGISVCFKLKFWNVGAEGQMMIAGVTASYFALYHADLPTPLLLIVMCVGAMIASGLYCLLAGFIKVQFRAGETIVTLLMNYIILYLVDYLYFAGWKVGAFQGVPFFTNGLLPKIGKLNIGFVFVIIAGLFVHFLLKKSRLGYQISVIGESEQTAVYSGMNVYKTTLLTTFIAGAIIGIAGFVQVSGNAGTLTTSMTMGFGYTGIIIAWLGNLDPKRIVLNGVLYSMLMQGVGFIESDYKLPGSAASLVLSIVLFAIMAIHFFNEYALVRREK